MKKRYGNFLIALSGLVLLGLGCILFTRVQSGALIELQAWRALPYVLIGLGCGLFGHGMGGVIEKRSSRTRPQVVARIDIEAKDERNAAIARRAKAKAYEQMVVTFGALMLALVVLNVDVWAILLLVTAYLYVVANYVYYHNKYQKEM